ncbi:NGO_0222 family membrane protein, partial [Neisseria elongata]
MTKRRTFLILTALFTLLFIALVTLGAYLLSIQSKQFAVAAFLFA